MERYQRRTTQQPRDIWNRGTAVIELLDIARYQKFSSATARRLVRAMRACGVLQREQIRVLHFEGYCTKTGKPKKGIRRTW